MDLLLTSESYEQNVPRISNDLIIAMIAATDTSRNTSIFALSMLTKKTEYRDKVREEIKACITKHGLSSASELTHKHTTDKDLPFLSWIINESMRFHPTGHSSEKYKINKDCKLGNYNFRKDDQMYFSIHNVHRDPNQWQVPDKFDPYRFDP